jgi:hypothetical protein
MKRTVTGLVIMCVLINMHITNVMNKKSSILGQLGLTDLEDKQYDSSEQPFHFLKKKSVIRCRDTRENTLLHHMVGTHTKEEIQRVIAKAKEETIEAPEKYKEWLAAKNIDGHGILCGIFRNNIIFSKEFVEAIILLKKEGAPCICNNLKCDPIVRLLFSNEYNLAEQCLKKGFSPVKAYKIFPEAIRSMGYFSKL